MKKSRLILLICLFLGLLMIFLFSACGVDTQTSEIPFENEEEASLDLFGLTKDPLAGEPVVPKCFEDLYGFVDLEGRVAIPAQYTYAEQMREGLAYAEKGEDKFTIYLLLIHLLCAIIIIN